MDFSAFLQKFGLAQNEARLYETLVRGGDLNVSRLSEKSGVNRRNVYDSLNRLIEKGLAIEIAEKRENLYRAMHPRKFREILREKELALSETLPKIEALYGHEPLDVSVQIFRGEEGWKNFMNDVLRAGESFCLAGAKGALASTELESSFSMFKKELALQNISVRVLYDGRYKDNKKILGHLGGQYKIIPEKYANESAFAVYGSKIVIFRAMPIEEKTHRDYSFIVINDKPTADAYRTWFEFMWDNSELH